MALLIPSPRSGDASSSGALYIVPALYYYFRLVVHAWLKDPATDTPTHVSAGQSVALAVTGLVTVAVGVYPELFIRMANYSMTLPAALFGR